MPEISEEMMLAFHDELAKEAGFQELVARAAPVLKGVGAGGGAGAALGAIGGGALGAYQRYAQARDEEGAGVGSALLAGAGGGLTGAAHGAAIGGAVGALGGGVAGHLGKDVSALNRVRGPVGTGARFGQRQVHALTGMLDTQGGLAGATQLASAGLQEPVQGMQLTSIPGVLRSIDRHGLKATAQEALHATASTAKGKAFMLGLPALGVAQALTHKKNSTDARGRGEEVGDQVGQMVGGIAGGALPIVGGLALQSAAGKAGGLIGRGVDRLRRGKIQTPPVGGTPGLSPTTLEPAEAQHTPSERIESPAAAGRQNEVGL